MKCYKWIIASLLLLCFLASGCTSEKPVDKPAEQTAVQTVKEQKFVVYRIVDSKQGYLAPEKFIIKDNGRPAPENALRTLIETTPQTSKLISAFPKGTKLLGLDIKDGIAFANVSKEIKNIDGGSYNELMAVGSIVNTLTEFPEIKKVQLLVEGRKIVTLNGHLDLDEPLERDTSLLSSTQKSKAGK